MWQLWEMWRRLTTQHQFTLKTDSGKEVSITTFGMDRVSGPVSKSDTEVLTDLFPGYDVDSAEEDWQGRYSPCCDYFGLFPMCEEAKCGENSSIMKGDFGVCLQGTHPDLKEGTEHDSNLAKTIHNSVIQAWSLPCTPWHSPRVSVRMFWPCNAGWHRGKEYKFRTSGECCRIHHR